MAVNESEQHRILSFGPFRLTDKPLRLFRGNNAVPLRRQALRLLRLLASHANDLVTHEEIRTAVWGNRYVDHSGGMHLLIREIRQALGDDSAKPNFIETVPRQGYRFIAVVSGTAMTAPATTPHVRHRVMTWLAGAVATGLLVGGVIHFPTDFERGSRNDQAEDGTARAVIAGSCSMRSLSDGTQYVVTANSFNAALQLDAAFTPAHTGPAKSCVGNCQFDLIDSYARKALQLDDRHAPAHSALAWVAIHRDWDWEKAGFHIQQSLLSDPDSATAHKLKALLMIIVGDRIAAKSAAHRASILDPHSPSVQLDSGWFHYYAGDYATGLQICSTMAAVVPEDPFALQCKFKSALLAGDTAHASTVAARFAESWHFPAELVHKLESDPGPSSLRLFLDRRRDRIADLKCADEYTAEQFAVTYAEIGDYDVAAELIGQALNSPSARLPYILRDPVFQPLHMDPRFQRALSIAGLPARITSLDDRTIAGIR